MSRRVHKTIHAAAMIWFFTAVGYLLVSTLRAAGVGWLVIFSLSGQSAALLFLFMTFYLFAIFRGTSRGGVLVSEHPLTGSQQYLEVYSLMPFLGGIAGFLAVVGVSGGREVIAAAALGTLLATFVLWIVVDPALGALELLVPSCRSAYKSRKAAELFSRQQEQAMREKILKDLEDEELRRRTSWQTALAGEAEALAEMITEAAKGNCVDLRRATEIGLTAWRSGGLECMQFVQEKSNTIARNRGLHSNVPDYVAHWWHGVGGWRHYV